MIEKLEFVLITDKQNKYLTIIKSIPAHLISLGNLVKNLSIIIPVSYTCEICCHDSKLKPKLSKRKKKLQ